MTASLCRFTCLLVVLVWATGCGGPQAKPIAEQSGKQEGPSAAGAKFLLQAEPPDAKAVLAAREAVKNDEDVVLVGRIGGGDRPMGENAFFTIVDLSKNHCPKDEGCKTPWDYCCTDKAELLKATAFVKFESAPGRTLATDARTLLGVKELDVVVVRGKAKRDGTGNLVVLGDGIYVKEKYDPAKE